jgi:hypothetical protein
MALLLCVLHVRAIVAGFIVAARSKTARDWFRRPLSAQT